MASNLVIVAIPTVEDDVWKVSSEQVPHLTLLFLGDAMSNPNVAKIVEKTQQEARYLEPFSLLVDHRGFLGPDEADVLFFGPDTPWQLQEFRFTLLGNQEISMAYNAIPQRPVWTPHLTLGYPDTPAHSDDWDPMGVQYVSFDKVAVWYGDYEGSEFALTPNPKPKVSDEVAAWAQQIGNDIKHHGIKGMRWGVRRKNPSGPNPVVVNVDHNKLRAKGGEGYPPAPDAIKKAATTQKAKASGIKSLSNDELKQAIERMNLENNFKQASTGQKNAGKKFVANLLVNTGKNQAQLLANQAASQAVKQAIKAAHK